jgi:hypothetical protein
MFYWDSLIIPYIMHILRGNLLKALREKYFCDAKKNAEDFIGWKPDEIHEVKAKTWESVDITCLPPILVIGIYRIVNQVTEEGTYTETKLNDNFEFPVVRSELFQA